MLHPTELVPMSRPIEYGYVSEFLGILKYPLSPKRTLGSLIRKKTETKIFPLLQS